MVPIKRDQIIEHTRIVFSREFSDEEPLLRDEADAIFLGLLGGLRWSALRTAWKVRHSEPDEEIKVLRTEDGFATQCLPHGELVHHIADVSGLDEPAARMALSAIESYIQTYLDKEANLEIAVEDLGSIAVSSPGSRKFTITLSSELAITASHQPKAMGAGSVTS
jgi:hypothetical protein